MRFAEFDSAPQNLRKLIEEDYGTLVGVGGKTLNNHLHRQAGPHQQSKEQDRLDHDVEVSFTLS